MTPNLRLRATLALLSALALNGCAYTSTAPEWERGFGQTVHATMAAQIRDPDAATRARAPESLDGRAAKRAQERYEQSFTERPVQDSLMTGLAK